MLKELPALDAAVIEGWFFPKPKRDCADGGCTEAHVHERLLSAQPDCPERIGKASGCPSPCQRRYAQLLADCFCSGGPDALQRVATSRAPTVSTIATQMIECCAPLYDLPHT